MKKYLGVLVGVLGLGVVGFGVRVGSDAAALSYQASTGMKFTFNPTLNLTVSGGDLVIAGLAPGNSADSNEITVTVGTNTAHGYALYATAGNSSYSGSSNFAANDLVLTNGGAVDTTQTNKFTSLATDANVASMSSANPNTWGYAYATYNASGSTWNSYSNYSGLPVYTASTGAELINTNDAADNQSVKFIIGANADDTQASGDYTNVINFYAVVNPEPEPSSVSYCETMSAQYCMQDVSTWGSNLSSGNDILAMDDRDGKTYTVARLADGNIWMTQNLDHDIDSEFDYNSFNTDVPSGWDDTLASTRITSDTNWGDDHYAPESYDPGNLCWNGVLESENTETCGNDKHYHLGNYYNWTAAVAMEDSTEYDLMNEDTDVDQSICPAGWRLPIVQAGGATPVAKSFNGLMEAYGWTDSTYTVDSPYVWQSPLYYPLSGYWQGSMGEVSFSGYYWSSVVISGEEELVMFLATDNTGYTSFSAINRSAGITVRCVARSS